MNQKKLNVIFGIVIVVLIVVVAYFAIGRRSEPVNNPVVDNTTNNPVNQTSPTKTVQPTQTPLTTTPAETKGQLVADPKDVVSVMLPTSWANNGFSSSGAFIGDVKQTFGAEWGEGTQFQPTALPKYPVGGAVGLVIFKFPSSAPEFTTFLNKIGIGHTQDKNITINGYSGYYSEDITNSYTDHYYLVSYGDILVLFSFREISRGFSPGGTTVTREEKFTQYLPDFESIVNSIKFK